MLQVVALSWPRSAEAENEDALVVSADVAVVVDGAGLPRELRAGCSHSVAWFARSIADAFHRALEARTGTMTDALATAIEVVAATHSSVCDLAAGSPSATVAAWRRSGDRLEHLVLCDASLVLRDARDRSTQITDGRLDALLRTAADDFARAHPDAAPAAVQRTARRGIEQQRNREGGFWVVSSDPSAAMEALTGTIPVADLAGVIACSDGASRAYDLLFTCTLGRFAADCIGGEAVSVAAAVRRAEEQRADELEERGLKAHDDLTIVAARL